MPIVDAPPVPPPPAPPAATLQMALPVAVSQLDVAFTAEKVTVADGPQMGMVGLHALRPVAGNWWLGPSVFGAVSGDRGGFFGWGLSAAYRWRHGDWSAEAGLFAGGGGGSPGWVGGGLMLRPSLAVARDFGPLRLGLGVAQLRFPSGTVNARQPFATLGWTGDALFGPPGGGPPEATAAWGDRAWPTETAATFGQYRLRHGSARRDGTGSGPPLRVAGFVVRRDVPGRVAGWQPYGLLGAAGSLSAEYAGYAELLGGLGLRYTPASASAWTLQAEAAVGSGGAGTALDTAGGALQKISLGLSWQASRQLAVAAQAGIVDSRGRFKAHEARFELAWRGWDVVPGAPRGLPGPDAALAWQTWAAGASWAHYTQMPRDAGGAAGLGLVVLKLEREIGPQWRLVGAAGIAASGAAGGYAAGHLGLGWLAGTPQGGGWRFGAEATLGAAGGGAVRVGDGLFGQVQGVARYAFTPAWSLQADAGWMRTRQGGMSTPFVGLGSVVTFSRLQAP